MVNWEIITRSEKVWVTENNQKFLKDITIQTNEQIDPLGNIYQREGGVIPKKCQGCEQPFAAVPTSVPIKENVSKYICQQCSFMSNSAEDVWTHKASFPGHLVDKTIVERVVGDKVILVGKIAKIHLVKDIKGDITDCKIACQACLDSGKVAF